MKPLLNSRKGRARRVKLSLSFSLIHLLFCLVPMIVWAQKSDLDLTNASLEDLMNIEVTSVSKREEKLFQTAAAIYVITQEDIRRSGLSSIPEVLRLVPGLDVARIDGNKWAISARGFNRRFTNKLLVLIDGRSVYSPETTGVYWEAQDLPLEEIERIEIIRGPGGTLWGANAVNGVINIITKTARDTQGGLLTAGGGSEDLGFTGARYGGKVGENAYYRVYARYFKRSGLVDALGRNTNDGTHGASGGLRIDWKRSESDALTLHGDLSDISLRETPVSISIAAPFAPPINRSGEFTGGNVLGRWNHVFSERSDTALQVYFDRSCRQVYDLGERIDTLDLDFQHHFAFDRQDMVWGLGYRLIADQTNTNSGLPVQYDPKGQHAQIFSAFVQDEFKLIKDRLRLTLGTKVEHNDYSGFEAQPSVRLLWTPGRRQTVWGSVSRAVKTPARNDRGLRVNLIAFPGAGGLTNIVALFGGPNTRSEELRAYELGYRFQPSSKISFDVATFYNLYDHVGTAEPGRPFLEVDPPPARLIIPIRYDNLVHGETYGLEASASWDISSRLRIHGNYSFLRIQLHRYPTSNDPQAESQEGDSPRHQFQIHSLFKLPRSLELDTALYRISQLPDPQIPGYTRLDLRLGWRVREGIELSMGAQNLLESRHPEFNNLDVGVIPSQAKRSIYGRMAWRF